MIRTYWDPILFAISEKIKHTILIFVTDTLHSPLKWNTTREIMVCRNRRGVDIFHPNIPDKWVEQMFETMVQTPQHRYYIRTKYAQTALMTVLKHKKADGEYPTNITIEPVIM